MHQKPNEHWYGVCFGNGSEVDLRGEFDGDDVSYIEHNKEDVYKTIHMLLDRGNIEINWVDATQKNVTALMRAAEMVNKFLNPNLVTTLLDHGANHDLVDADGKTAGDYSKVGKEDFNAYVAEYEQRFASLTTTALCSSGGLPVPVAQLVMQYDPRFGKVNARKRKK